MKLQLGLLPPLKLSDLNGLTADHKTAFLEYVIADDKVYLFVLTKNAQGQSQDLQVHSIPIKRSELVSCIERIHQMMAERRHGFGALSRELYDLLIKPAEPQLLDKTTICIIPDGMLWKLPFQALQPREDRYLIEDFAVFHTHGTFDNRHPLYSFLLFAKAKDGAASDGLLEAREIVGLKLNADLVVLSACDTARRRIGAGEGVIGLSWAFFAAGSRSTLVSQWKVNSAGAADWMERFYLNLREPSDRKAVTKADALRLAVLTMMKDGRYGHPFYWSGFVLIGDNGFIEPQCKAMSYPQQDSMT